MSEETTLVAPTLPEQKTEPIGRQELTVNGESLVKNFFDVETTTEQRTEQPVIETKIESPVTETKKEEPQEEIIEPKDWLKREFGVEDAAILKAEREELKKLKETPAQYTFANDESKRLAEAIAKGDRKTVLNILETQDKLESLTAAEVNDNTAESIIKLSMQLKGKVNGVELSADEINYKYNKEFGIPREPVKKEDELDEDFDARKTEWQERVNDIKMNRSIEAKLAKPELEKLKTQIVLPDISQSSAQIPPTQEELDAVKKYDDAFVQSVENSVKTFNGITVAVKNEVVDFPVTFGATEEDKTMLSSLMKDFQKGNYDANGLFANLWVNEDKTLKTDQMIEDYYLIKNKKALFSKIANDSANKALEAYIKEKKKINVNETSNPGTAVLTKEDKTEMDLVRDQIFG